MTDGSLILTAPRFAAPIRPTVSAASSLTRKPRAATLMKHPVAMRRPILFDLGAVSNRLAVGSHILAFVGINQTLASSDFHLIPDLALAGGSGGSAVLGNFLAIVA